MISILDYGAGNIGSIKNMLARLGIKSNTTKNIKDLINADKLIIPGVGHFDYGIRALRNLFDLKQLIEIIDCDDKQTLGICLGAQMMCNFSEEGSQKGLGIFNANVVRFRFKKKKLKVPHMGWNTVKVKEGFKLWTEDNSNPRFYHVHSYHFEVNDASIAYGTTQYGYDFPVILQDGNKFAVQFHPEKSHKFGMQILNNFAKL